MPRTDPNPPLEKVVWELPKEMLENLREYCKVHDLKECDTVCRAIKRYLSERLLEEGE